MQDIKPLVEKTGTPDLLPFMVNDFGMRGVCSFEAAAYGGAAHMVSGFVGSDNMAGNRLLKDYYGATSAVTKSVWATEHSVATSFGPGIGEMQYLLNQLENAPEDAIISIVIDSYGTFKFIDDVVGSEKIKKIIINRPGRVVFRPDSGVPKEIVNRLLESLRNIFGYTYNDKGYKVLNYNVGIIQGDGMERETILDLYESITKNGWSTDNVVVGSGGGLLQKVNRDTQRFAIKASYGELNEKESFDIQKNPGTDPTKASKAGKLILHKSADMYGDSYSTKKYLGNENYHDALETVFENGKLIKELTYEEITQ